MCYPSRRVTFDERSFAHRSGKSSHTTPGGSMLPEIISLLEQTRVLIDRSTPQDIVEHTVGLVRQHDRYRSHCINLHAAESVSSPTAQRLMQSDLVRRTMIGDPRGPRFHTGAKYYDEIEVLVIELAKKLYGAHYVEWRLLSSSMADGLVVHSLTDVGDTILALERPLGHGTWRETGYAGMRGLKILDIPFSMTSGGPGMATQTYSFYVYLTGLRNFNIGYASALAYILLAIMLPISLFLFRRLRQIYD